MEYLVNQKHQLLHLDGQMKRIADGLEAERDLIVHFKAKALEAAIEEDKSAALPLAGSVVDALKAIRIHADHMRQDTLKELAAVAEREAA